MLMTGKETRGMSILANAQQHQVKRPLGDYKGFIRISGRLRTPLGGNRENLFGRNRHMCQQGMMRHHAIAIRVIHRQTTLVAKPDKPA